MRSYLVVGNQTLDSPLLAAAIADRTAGGPSTIHVVVPATPIRRGLTWDEEEARQVAQERLDAMLARLGGQGIEATGEIGAPDPIEAVEDAIRGREVDEILLSTLPSGISRWLGQDVPTRLAGSVTVPVVVLTEASETVPSA
jgi:nucleotide-binding universal stress UspA family protein